MSFVLEAKPQLVQIKSPTKKSIERGCLHCPSNKTKGITKLFNKVKDRKIIVFTTYPGPAENSKGKTLSGSSGEFLWDELAKVGIDRTDCDVQNSVRCYPADRRDGSLYKREPKKEEIHCCSIYNDKAKSETHAKIYIVLGAMAHKAILGKEYKKSKKIFWSPELKARVYCLAHPNYFLGGHAPQIALTEFRDALKSVATDLKSTGKISQYAYLEKQAYRAVKTPAALKELWKTLRTVAASGKRIAVDIEWDVIEEKKYWLSCAYSYKPGQADVVILDHPQARKVDGKWIGLDKATRRTMHRINAKILSDPKLKKAFHQGSSDVPFIESYNGTKVRGYDYDTIYAEFFAHPDRRAYGLNAIGLQKYPQFGDYKNIILPEALAAEFATTKGLPKNADLDQTYKFAARNNLFHFSQLPLKKLVLRNGADADITKRLELSTRKKISLPLLKIYRDAAFVLSDMEANGPEFDYSHLDKLYKLYPPKLEAVKNKLFLISGNKKFNPNSHPQVKELLYKKLRLEPPEVAFDKKKKRKKDKNGDLLPIQPGSNKTVLEVLGREHEAPRLINECRRLGKIVSTYLNAYKSNADQHAGRLKTKWWMTGTQTGRLSSGGDKEVKESKNLNINLQNIHGDKNLKNLAVPDKSWRKLYVAIHKAVEKLYPKDLDEISRLVKHSKDSYGAVNALKMKLYNSDRFKRLSELIVDKLGDICIMLGFDEGQIEVRVMAQASGDKNLIRDCMSGDIHSKVGHAMTGWPVEKIKKDKKTRTLTKNIHFGILFGLGADGLLRFIKAKDPNSTITEEEAQRLYDNYFKAYPGVRKFIEKMRAFVEANGYVENMFGFKRPLNTGAKIDGYESDENNEEETQGGAYWGNQAINSPIQGAAHQLMLMALATLKRLKKKYALLGVPTIEVHDYLGFKVKLKNIIRCFGLCKELLEKEPLNVVAKDFPWIKWLIPLVVEGEVGLRLGDSVEGEEDGKMKQMHELLADMFLCTHVQELKLKAELKAVAA